MATNWDTCPAVERDPQKLSGALIFRNTRILPALVTRLRRVGGIDLDQLGGLVIQLRCKPRPPRRQDAAVESSLRPDVPARRLRRAFGAGGHVLGLQRSNLGDYSHRRSTQDGAGGGGRGVPSSSSF